MSKKGLFTKAFNEQYGGIVEYRANSNVTEIDARSRTAITELGERVRADVLNVMPSQAAGEIARKTGLVNANNRWCQVDWVTMESTAAPGRARAGRCHVVGAGHAQVGPHGQPARQDGGRGHRRDCWAAVCRSPR
jgi:NADPH-dependent 2,4-dienoyl-CoA reductase/sulfur reductase-like enzyme